MTFFQKLERQLKTKGHCVVWNNLEDYCVFSHFKNEDGNYRMSEWYESTKEAKECIGGSYGYLEKRINELAQEENWQIIEAFEIPLERFKAGDKVLVSKDAKRLCKEYGIGWGGSGMDKMLGLTSVIEGISRSVNTYKVYNQDKSDYWNFPHSALSYPLDDEETIKIEGKRYHKGYVL